MSKSSAAEMAAETPESCADDYECYDCKYHDRALLCEYCDHAPDDYEYYDYGDYDYEYHDYECCVWILELALHTMNVCPN